MPSTKNIEDIDNQSNTDSEIHQPKKRRALYYTSNIPDSYIKNAMSGHVYPYKVGSLESLQLYKVMDATGTVDNDGVKLSVKNLPNGTSNILYYDNPEEYMRHRRIKLDQVKINAWNNKVNRLFPKGKFNKEEWIKMNQEIRDKYTFDFENRVKIKSASTNSKEKRRRANSAETLRFK